MSEQQKTLNTNSSTAEIGKENPVTEPVARTSGSQSSSQLTRNLHSSSNNKSNLEDFTANDEEPTKNVESNSKRNKNEGEKNAEDSSGEEEPLLEELIFSNNLLLKNIFKHLDVKDLYSSRQVNRLWNVEASKLLIQKNIGHEILIQSNDTAVSYYRLKSHHTITLEDFQNLVENSVIFPCGRFAVVAAPMSDRTKDLFQNNGHIVKFLRFEPTQVRGTPLARRTTEYDILLLATKHLPNLEVLEFSTGYKESSPPTAETEEAIKCSAQMEKLHTLELKGYFPVHLLSLVLKKTRSLKNIYFNRYEKGDGYKIGLQKFLEVQDALPLLQNIWLEFSPDMLDIFERVAMQSPRFSTIQDVCACTETYGDLNLRRVGRILSNIFEQSSESLNGTLYFRYLGHIPGLTIPVFPNLKRLKIWYAPTSPDFYPPVVPFGVKLADKCPNVKRVDCSFGVFFALEGPVHNLPQELWGSFISVRHLEVSFGPRFDSDDFVETFCSFFPNLLSIRVNNVISDRALEHIRRRGIWIAPRVLRK